MVDTDIKKKELINLFSKNEDYLLSPDKAVEVKKVIEKIKLPDSKTEEWRDTDIKTLLRHRYNAGTKFIVPDEYVNTFSFYGLDTDRIVFVNGFFSPENSKINKNKSKIILGSLKEAKKDNFKIFEECFDKTKLHNNNFFTAINTAFSEDGAFIFVPDNTVIETPVHIVNFINGNENKIITQSRNLIIAGKNSQVKILSSYHSLSTDFTINNVGTEIFAKEDSNIEFYIFEGEGNEASHINNTFVHQYKGSSLKANTVTLCGSLVRNELHIDFKDEHCEADLQGIYLPDKEQHVDNFVNIKHSKPYCISKQLYKGILDNKAKAVFTGKVFVAPGAQKTDASQSNKNLLLSDNAKVYSRPQLEIYADDVKCAHGSTTGQLDREALFYLKSRGIPERRAKIMLMTAFVKDVLNKIEIIPYRDYVNFLVNKRLKGQKVEGLCFVKACPNC